MIFSGSKGISFEFHREISARLADLVLLSEGKIRVSLRNEVVSLYLVRSNIGFSPN